MTKTLLRTVALLCAFAPFAPAVNTFAQTEDPTPAHFKLEDTETTAKLTALRDAFVKQIVTEGFSCPIKPPTIVLHQIPSFRNYNNDDNTITSPAWHQLGPEEKALFHHLAGPDADDAAARAIFESGSHRWIFIHELGHWWQACKRASDSHARTMTPYQTEYEADRIDAAYWKQTDPAFLARMMDLFHHMYEAGPNPVPEGTDAVKFFNDNYGEALAKTNAYPWFQARMIVGVDAEKSAATFAQTLRDTGK